MQPDAAPPPAEALLEGLDDAQTAAVTTEASPLCILAGAGSGKTRVVTRRIAYRTRRGTADPRHVLALTFTRKAAGELRSRLLRLGVADHVVAGTFHAVAYAQLRRRWADRGESPPALLDRKVRLLGPLLGPAATRAGLQPADVAAEIEWAKARLVTPPDYEERALAAGRTPPVPAAQLAAVYQRYETEKRRRGLVDFDDLLGLCARAFDADADFAAAQRWRFRHLFVDEFQDVNPLQFRLLTGWLGERRDLCVVGDPNQAIYSWNGADPGLLAGFATRFPGCEIVRLDHNYRSTPQILAVAAAALAPGSDRSSPTTVAHPGPPLRAHRPDGPIPTVEPYEDDTAEAAGIAARLRLAHRPGTTWSSLAVLTRTNAQAVLLEGALRAAGIPYRVRSGGAFLAQPEIETALGQLAEGAPAPFGSRLHRISAMANESGPEERRLNLLALLRLGQEYAAIDDEASVGDFRTWLSANVRRDDPDDGGDAVELATFHRAKGLEWEVVFVAGLERGLVPIGQAESGQAAAEERRLLYVALTRARAELHCSWAERRTFGARTVPRSPSPYLAAIEAAARGLERGATPVDWRPFLQREKVRLAVGAGGPANVRAGRLRLEKGGGGEPDPGVLAALRAWRSSAARAASVPAHVIFHDTTLAALAEAKPRDRAALLAVPGVGPVKASRYGDTLLAMVAGHRRSA